MSASASPAPCCEALADVVEAGREEIIARWTDRASRDLGEHYPRPLLVNSLPEFLDEAIAALRRGSRARAIPERRGPAAAAEKHGAQRLRLGLDVNRLVWEYGVLRETLFDVVEEAQHPATLTELRVLSEIIASGVAGAVRRYVAERDAQMADAEERFASLAEHAPAAVVLADADLRLRFVNPFAAELAGRAEPEILARTVHEVFGPDFAGRLAVTARPGAGSHSSELELETARGRRTFRLVVFPVPQGRGRPGVGGLATDVTERKAAERAAEHAAEVLELGDASIEVDREWRVTRVNRNLERLAGMSRRELVGRIVWDIWPQLRESWGRGDLRARMDDRVAREFEEYLAPLGIWAYVTAYPVRAGGLVAFIRDVSSRKRAEQELERVREFERQLIGIVSHDLRNPLNAILLAAATLQTRDDLPERHRKKASRIQAAAERALRLVRDLLDFTRARIGAGIPVDRRDVDAGEVVRHALEDVESAFPGRAVRITAAGPLRGSWDPDRLAQVVGNLATNALKYSPPGTPVSVALEGTTTSLRMRFHNGGAPIPAEKLPGIFDQWRRATRTQGGGIGLGLYIVERIVSAHGGRVEVTSSTEDGTTVLVELPKTVASNA